MWGGNIRDLSYFVQYQLVFGKDTLRLKMFKLEIPIPAPQKWAFGKLAHRCRHVDPKGNSLHGNVLIVV